MFKLTKTTWLSMICLMLASSFMFQSCSSDDGDDDNNSNNCTTAFTSQNATGDFMGDSFTLVEGTAVEDFADSTQMRIVFYGETVMGDACDNFNFDKPKLTVIFSVPMTVGSYDLGAAYSVTFNDATVVNTVNATVAVCGAVEITSMSDTEVTGKIDAQGDAESFINGDFTVTRCN